MECLYNPQEHHHSFIDFRGRLREVDLTQFDAKRILIAMAIEFKNTNYT